MTRLAGYRRLEPERGGYQRGQGERDRGRWVDREVAHGRRRGLCGGLEGHADGGYEGLLLPAGCGQCYGVRVTADHSPRDCLAVAVSGEGGWSGPIYIPASILA